MNINLRFILLLLIPIWGGCNREGNRPVSSKSTDIIQVDVDNACKVNMSEIFTGFRYVPLWTNKKNPVGNIDKLIITKNHIGIQDNTNRVIWIFSRNGKLESKINVPNGEGPGETSFLNDFIIDDSDNIHVLGNAKIMVFSLQGTLKKEVIIKFIANNFTYISNSKTYVLYMHNSLSKSNTIRNTATNLVFLDNRGQLIGQALPINFRDRDLGVLIPNNFPRYKDHILCFGGIDYNIYELGSDSVKVRYRIDFGDHNITDDALNQRSKQISGVDFFDKAILSRDYVSTIEYFSETSNLIHFVFLMHKDPYWAFYSKNNGKIILASQINNDLDFGPNPVFRVAYDDSLFAQIQFYELKEHTNALLYKQNKLDNPNVQELIQLEEQLSIKHNDNPVIMIGGLKK